MARLINVHRPSTSPQVGDARSGAYVPVTYRLPNGERVPGLLADLGEWIKVANALAARSGKRTRS